MCLMCEWYYETCGEAECVIAARSRAKADPVQYRDEYFTSRSGKPAYFLHQGVAGPCKHMTASHGPECTIIKKHEDPQYGLIYETCNCYKQDGEWTYE